MTVRRQGLKANMYIKYQTQHQLPPFFLIEYNRKVEMISLALWLIHKTDRISHSRRRSDVAIVHVHTFANFEPAFAFLTNFSIMRRH